MSLRTVSFQDTYWSGENDLIKEFYVPCMEESIEYCRAVGYFNSSILCYITNGLYPFIQNGGRMRIVCSVNLSPEDERQIALGYDIRHLLEDKIDPVTQSLIDLNIANIKNLCWLIKNNRLDIKVCLRKDPNDPGTYHLFHEKFGIFKDADGNADDEDVLVAGVFWLLWTAVHGQELRLRQDDVVSELRVHVRLDVLRLAPAGRSVFFALP